MAWYPVVGNHETETPSDMEWLRNYNRNRFVTLLQEHNVTAYIFCHTYNYSIVKINKLWHIDVGQSRGTGYQGSRSTFVKININGNHLDYETYRLNLDNYKYEKADSADLD